MQGTGLLEVLGRSFVCQSVVTSSPFFASVVTLKIAERFCFLPKLTLYPTKILHPKSHQEWLPKSLLSRSVDATLGKICPRRDGSNHLSMRCLSPEARMA